MTDPRHAPDCPRRTGGIAARCSCPTSVSPSGSPWSAEVDALMLDARRAGHSFSQVATMIEDRWPDRVVSRNAVKGRLERIADRERRRVALAELEEMGRE